MWFSEDVCLAMLDAFGNMFIILFIYIFYRRRDMCRHICSTLDFTAASTIGAVMFNIFSLFAFFLSFSFNNP